MISVNDVYQTVLTILNKEQRGYLDTTEFTNIAIIAQREIFETYFVKAAQVPSGGDVIVDPAMFIDERISYYLMDAQPEERNEDSFFEWPDNFYRLGLVVNTENNTVIDNVSHMQARYLNLSPLTAPKEKQGIYTIENGGIQVYPNDDANAITQINMQYMREPIPPFIEETVDSDGDIVMNLSTAVDFDLHPSEFTDIVLKICAYAGVVVRAAEVTSFAQGKEGQLQGTEQ